MRLIGMLDSPYVRRVAVALHLMEVPFVHEPVSVIRQFDAFAAVNPVLMDSSLILQYAERRAAPGGRLAPHGEAMQARALRASGLAMAACEKTVAIVYETVFRLEDKRHRPWLDRVVGQMRHAFGALEAEMPEAGGWLAGDRPMQADIDVAVAWGFTRGVLSEIAPCAIPPASTHPRLDALAERAEALPAFRAAPPE